MLNRILKKELSMHFKKINEREKIIEDFTKTLGLKDVILDKLCEEINIEITNRIKECLDRVNFDYNNDRNRNGDRIDLVGGIFRVRRYRTHDFYNVDIINSTDFDEFIPIGLIRAREIINKKIKYIKNINLEFEDNINLNKSIFVQKISDDEIINNRIKEIRLEVKELYFTRLKIILNGYNDYKYALYSDKFFNFILLFIEKYKNHIKEINQTKEEMCDELRNFVYNQIDKMILLEELK